MFVFYKVKLMQMMYEHPLYIHWALTEVYYTDEGVNTQLFRTEGGSTIKKFNQLEFEVSRAFRKYLRGTGVTLPLMDNHK